MGLGLRYDRQSSLRDHNNFSPRLSLSFAPGQSRRTVIRTGAGIFYDRTVAKAVRERLFFDGQRLRRFRVSDPGFPEPFGDPASTQVPPSSVVMFGPDLKSPYIVEYSLALEHELKKRLSASITYSGTRGVNIFRSRDVNAPLPPSYESRPNPSIGLHRQIESSGNLSGHRVKAALRGRLSSLLNGSVEYELGRIYDDTGGIESFPADSYDLTENGPARIRTGGTGLGFAAHSLLGRSFGWERCCPSTRDSPTQL